MNMGMRMSYYIDPNVMAPPFVYHPCTFVASRTAGKTLLCREDGYSMVVEPDGSQVRWEAPADPNFDSPWTQADALGDMLMFRSAAGTNPGVPRGYRMIR